MINFNCLQGNIVNKLNLIGALIALSCGAAQAGTIQVGGTAVPGQGKVSALSGVCSVNFNGGNAANTCGAVYSGTSAGNFRATSVSGVAAQPAGDTSSYFTVGPTDGSPVTITLSSTANYFGFYAGSLDSYNLVQFYLGTTLVDSFNGTQINAVAFPTQPTDGDQSEANYIDYFLQTNAFYNRIVYSSTANAFETDNHAFGLAAPTGVPEPTSVALFGLGALALVARRRARSA